ncbi:MAG TPA: ATP-binding protein, partial [Aggregatilineales bacterium]|nr:ATP-binding protein [Aggregatilineales bacterium]
MTNLNDQEGSGYTLQYLEVYNWGTFNRQIEKICPTGETALLTGKNGSGKSTLVDALMTLLVPNRKRTYNQSSGERRKERDEKTYVRGAYNRLREAGTRDGQVQYLREGNDQYTVLLAVFRSPHAKPESITLAQVLWHTDTGLEKFHVVAPQPLSIEEHFKVSGSVSALRKSLRKSGSEVYDQFNDYSAAFRKLFRLRSEKALELFSQTVSIKEIGSLNQFIRAHMLEETNAEEQIERLRDNYLNLTLAHEAIVKAERQQALLSPIVQDGEKYDELTAQIDEVRAAEEVIPLYFTYRRGQLLITALTNVKRDLAENETECQKREIEVNDLDGKRVDLRLALQHDEIGQLLSRLKEEQERLSTELVDRKGRALQYDKLAAALGMSVYTDSSMFHSNRQVIGES